MWYYSDNIRIQKTITTVGFLQPTHLERDETDSWSWSYILKFIASFSQSDSKSMPAINPHPTSPILKKQSMYLLLFYTVRSLFEFWVVFILKLRGHNRCVFLNLRLVSGGLGQNTSGKIFISWCSSLSGFWWLPTGTLCYQSAHHYQLVVTLPIEVHCNW